MRRTTNAPSSCRAILVRPAMVVTAKQLPICILLRGIFHLLEPKGALSESARLDQFDRACFNQLIGVIVGAISMGNLVPPCCTRSQWIKRLRNSVLPPSGAVEVKGSCLATCRTSERSDGFARRRCWSNGGRERRSKKRKRV